MNVFLADFVEYCWLHRLYISCRRAGMVSITKF